VLPAVPAELPLFWPPAACAKAPPDTVSAATAATNAMVALFMIRPSLVGLE